MQAPFVLFGWFGPPVSPGDRRYFGSLLKKHLENAAFDDRKYIGEDNFGRKLSCFFKSRSCFCKIILETVVLFCK